MTASSTEPHRSEIPPSQGAGEHTPGPWSIHETVSHSHDHYDSGRRIIVSELTGTCVAHTSHGWDDVSIPVANARLITAAPDLLEALLNVRAIIAEAAMTGFNWQAGDWAERLFASQATTSAAIAKATGTLRERETTATRVPSDGRE
jgi:hypothetical protein